ncbi:uncharacterized protein STEHIDRAFT_134633 [Stereum hirsutum FP-91666 SS1]|uniref:uncharacterized protein n=1 Tax=Stereum hirsutum (strain FP-91666) TaxID=721885 RepID=UPI000444A064|nr:uncharacterized protein STEHIDRAFT_134633 [Stereum hirsutum FP-91666 SS1]EIM81712.1 hypothetical protein STEHIDRAFT_134633 [Stereum hirsutum FP-91666 SS1]
MHYIAKGRLMLGPVSFVAGACEIQALMREEDEHEIEEMHAKRSAFACNIAYDRYVRLVRRDSISISR